MGPAESKNPSYSGAMLLVLLACSDAPAPSVDTSPPDSGPTITDTAPPTEPVTAAITASTAFDPIHGGRAQILSLIHISEPTRL